MRLLSRCPLLHSKDCVQNEGGGKVLCPCRAVGLAVSHMQGQSAAQGPKNSFHAWCGGSQQSAQQICKCPHAQSHANRNYSRDAGRHCSDHHVIILRYPSLQSSCLLHSKGKRSTHCSNSQAKYPGPAEPQFCKCYFQSSLTSWSVLSTRSDCCFSLWGARFCPLH